MTHLLHWIPVAGLAAMMVTGCGGQADDCAPVTDDAAMIDAACAVDADCADGYVCQEFNGIILMQSCQIPCTRSCGCPEGFACLTVTDKAGSFMQCAAAE